MEDFGEKGIPESLLLKKILVLLDDMKISPAGAIIHSHIGQMLSELEAGHKQTEQAYAGFLNMLLEACISLVPVDSPLHTHLRLLQLRLTPPLSLTELDILKRSFEPTLNELATSGSIRGSELVQALMPVIERFGVQGEAEVLESRPAPSPEPAQTVEASRPVPPPPTAPAPSEEETAKAGRDEFESEQDIAEFQVNSAYRAHLEEKREEMQKLQQDFIDQLGEAVTESDSFGRILEDSLATMQQAESIEELEGQRRELLQSLEKMLGGHKELGEKFSRAQEYLTIIEDDNQQLTDELDRVRLLSMTDDLTRLPNRRAFMRRLEDEVSRVQRHSYPLGLILLDIDHFKRINDQRGHAAGDTVLRCYANDILSIFRHHDLVARYGGEEFAILLPNTTQEGVLCALEKVRRRIAEVGAQRDPEDVPIPTFSAGVAEFKPGEAPTSLIERADSALYAAKRKGRNRTEVSDSGIRHSSNPPSGGVTNSS